MVVSVNGKTFWNVALAGKVLQLVAHGFIGVQLEKEE